MEDMKVGVEIPKDVQVMIDEDRRLQFEEVVVKVAEDERQRHIDTTEMKPDISSTSKIELKTQGFSNKTFRLLQT